MRQTECYCTNCNTVVYRTPTEPIQEELYYVDEKRCDCQWRCCRQAMAAVHPAHLAVRPSQAAPVDMFTRVGANPPAAKPRRSAFSFELFGPETL